MSDFLNRQAQHFVAPLTRRGLLGACAVSGAMSLPAGSVVRSAAAASATAGKKSVIYVFLSGGLAQQDTFDPKPYASAEVRGEFDPIATQTPDLQICEHLPLLAQRSKNWSLVRSLTHPTNDHSLGHLLMLTGRSDSPPGFDPSRPKPTDHPSMAALVGSLLPTKGSLPSSIILPEKLVHRTGRVLPGQFGGTMGSRFDPFLLTSCRFNATSYGAWPEYGFHHATGADRDESLQFQTPDLGRPTGVQDNRLEGRLSLLNGLERLQDARTTSNEADFLVRERERAITMLRDPHLRSLFDVTEADPKTLDRYGRNTFGWSLLMARRLVSEGVRFVQVYLGNNETWDTHGNAFPHLKNYLLPPFDRSLSALLDDLSERSMLDDTLVVVAGEFGRTPKISLLPTAYSLPGRDHWGAAQSVLVAGGGVQGGQVIGKTDRKGGYPVDSPQRPENLAATIYKTLGFSRDTVWHDLINRPIPLYLADPISNLL